MADQSFIPVPKKRLSVAMDCSAAGNRLATFSFGDDPVESSGAANGSTPSTRRFAPTANSFSYSHSRRPSTLSSVSVASGEDCESNSLNSFSLCLGAGVGKGLGGAWLTFPQAR